MSIERSVACGHSLSSSTGGGSTNGTWQQRKEGEWLLLKWRDICCSAEDDFHFLTESPSTTKRKPTWYLSFRREALAQRHGVAGLNKRSRGGFDRDSESLHHWYTQSSIGSSESVIGWWSRYCGNVLGSAPSHPAVREVDQDSCWQIKSISFLAFQLATRRLSEPIIQHPRFRVVGPVGIISYGPCPPAEPYGTTTHRRWMDALRLLQSPIRFVHRVTFDHRAANPDLQLNGTVSSFWALCRWIRRRLQSLPAPEAWVRLLFQYKNVWVYPSRKWWMIDPSKSLLLRGSGGVGGPTNCLLNAITPRAGGRSLLLRLSNGRQAWSDW